MQIVLYSNKTPLNRVTRSLTTIATLTGYLREGCGIFSPDIRVNYNAAYIGANYAYIAEYAKQRANGVCQLCGNNLNVFMLLVCF